MAPRVSVHSFNVVIIIKFIKNNTKLAVVPPVVGVLTAHTYINILFVTVLYSTSDLLKGQ
jgi:hypothetical protein